MVSSFHFIFDICTENEKNYNPWFLFMIIPVNLNNYVLQAVLPNLTTFNVHKCDG